MVKEKKVLVTVSDVRGNRGIFQHAVFESNIEVGPNGVALTGERSVIMYPWHRIDEIEFERSSNG